MICRTFVPEDKEAVMKLLTASFDGWHGDKNDQFWTWKFERNPHGEAKIYVAEHRDQLVGCYALMPMTLRLGDLTVSGAQVVDTAVSPAYRGRGVFINLARTAVNEAIQAGMQIVFAFPTADSFPGQVRVGYKPSMAIPFVHRPLLWPPRIKGGGGFTIGRAHAADARFDVFHTAGNERQVRVQHDHRFLQWRYAEHPTNSYKILTCESSDEICGYSVVSFGNDEGHGPPGYIVDLQVLPGERSAAALLVSHSLRELRSLGARIAVSWERPTGPEQEAMRAAGFSSMYLSVRRRLKRPKFVKQLIAFEADDSTADRARGDGRAANSRRWSLVPGDTDYM